MSAVEGLTEVATRAGSAAAIVRAAKWRGRQDLEKEADRVTTLLREASELSGMPPLFPDALNGQPAGLDEPADTFGTASTVSPDGPESDADEYPEGRQRAAIAEAVAARRVEQARVAVASAYLAVLQARIAALDAGDDAVTSDTVRGYAVPSTGESPRWGHLRAVLGAAGSELRHIVADRPRNIAFRLSVSLGFGLAYLLFLRIVLWDSARNEIPFLALYAFSGLAGSVVCTNALCVDAAVVQQRLLRGERLWHVLVAKNLAMFVIVGTLATGLNLLLFARYGDGTTLLKATGMATTMLLLWFGVGNLLSVADPLRVVSLGDRRRDGTLWRFLFSFVVSYGISYLVNLMLYWRIWAKQTLLERLDGPWIPVLLVVGSAAVVYVLFTVAAVLLAEQPRYRRRLGREVLRPMHVSTGTDGLAGSGAGRVESSPAPGESSSG